jgi:hypothetical protein
MARPLIGFAGSHLKKHVGQTVGWQNTIGPRVRQFEGAPSTGTGIEAEKKFLLGISTQSLEGVANGTSSGTGSMKSLIQLEGVANGTSSGSGNLVNLQFVAIQGEGGGTSSGSGNLSVRAPKGSLADASGTPRRMNMVPIPTPTTAVDEGVIFVSDGDGGLDAGQLYWRPESSGAVISMYEKTYVDDLAETLIFGGDTGGTDIILSNGDMILSDSSGAGVPGKPITLSPGTTVDTDHGALIWGETFSSTARGKAAIDLMFQRATSANVVQAGSSYSALIGGGNNTIRDSSTEAGIFAGTSNQVRGGAHRSVILGGRFNRVYSTHSVIVGGQYGYLYAGSDYTFMLPKWEAKAQDAVSSVILGDNFIYSTPPFTNNYLFVNGTGNVFTSNAGAGNRATAMFGRLNDIYGAYHSAVFGRFCRMNITAATAPVYGTLLGGNSPRTNQSFSAVWGQNHNTGTANGGYAGAYCFVTGENAQIQASGMVAMGAATNGTQYLEFIRRIQTTDATQTNIAGADPMTFPISANTSFREAIVIARDTATGDSAMWLLTFMVKTLADNTTSLVGTASGTGTPSAFNDAGAATWDVQVAVTTLQLQILVTGEVGKTIVWMARLTGNRAT